MAEGQGPPAPWVAEMRRESTDTARRIRADERPYLDPAAELRKGNAYRLDHLADVAESVALPEGYVLLCDLLRALRQPPTANELPRHLFEAVPDAIRDRVRLNRPYRRAAYPPEWVPALRAEAVRLRLTLIGEPRQGDREPTEVTPGQVRAWVREAGYTQAQAADALGVGPGDVSAWVRGVRRPPDWAVRHLRWLARTRGGQG